MSSEAERIYVIVADTVQPDQFTTVKQVSGRIAAQVAHVVSRVRVAMTIDLVDGLFESNKKKAQDALYGPDFLDDAFKPITTIVLSVRNSKELDHIASMLNLVGVSSETFFDTNGEVYGWDEENNETRVLTAVATHPVTPDDVKDVLSYLPLWKASDDN